MFVQDEILTRPTGGKYFYKDKTGKEHKYFEKDIPNTLLDIIMEENPLELSREEVIEASSREIDMETEASVEKEKNDV